MTEKRKVINRKHKDRLFLKIFKEKESLLALYNALNGTTYANEEDLEITTIDDALYMRMKNDVSFLFGEELHLYEHQSTCNPNMPLRGLLYLSQVYEGLLARNHQNLFSSRLVKIPEPGYLVFYNGKKEEPDRKELLLSEAFIRKGIGAPNLEFKATMLNINLGKNQELMERCRELSDYAHLIYYIREYLVTENLEHAVYLAVEQCVEEGILSDFLLKHRGEVYGLILSEYDEQTFLESERKIWMEEGKAEGEGLFAELTERLLKDSRIEDLRLAAKDKVFRDKLYQEYKLR